MTRRLVASHTLAISGRAVLELRAQGTCYAREFMPRFIQRLKAVQNGVGKSLVSGPESIPAWFTSNDRLFEQNRVLDPAPIKSQVRNILDNVRCTFPDLAQISIAGAWSA